MGGALATVSALELATTVLRALLERTGVDPAAIDGVIAAQGYPTMEAPAFGRVAALDAGFPVETTGYQLDRRCGSGLQAVLNAAMEVQTGVSEAVVALGAESMSNAPLYTVEGRRGRDRRRAPAARRAGPGSRDRRRPAVPDARRQRGLGRAAARRLRHLARGAGRVRPAVAPAGRRRAGVGRVRRRARAGRGAGPARQRRSSTATSIPAPTRRSRRSPGCGRSSASAMPTRP